MEIQNIYLAEEIWMYILPYNVIPYTSLVCRRLYELERLCMSVRVEDTKRRFPTMDSVINTKDKGMVSLALTTDISTRIDDPVVCVCMALKNGMYKVAELICSNWGEYVRQCMDVHICRCCNTGDMSIMREILKMKWIYQTRMVDLAIEYSAPSFTDTIVQLVREGYIDIGIIRNTADAYGRRYLSIAGCVRCQIILADIEDDQRDGDIRAT